MFYFLFPAFCNPWKTIDSSSYPKLLGKGFYLSGGNMVLNLLYKNLQCCFVLGQNQCFTKHRTNIKIRLLYNKIHFCLCHNKTTIQSVISFLSMVFISTWTRFHAKVIIIFFFLQRRAIRLNRCRSFDRAVGGRRVMTSTRWTTAKSSHRVKQTLRQAERAASLELVY